MPYYLVTVDILGSQQLSPWPTFNRGIIIQAKYLNRINFKKLFSKVGVIENRVQRRKNFCSLTYYYRSVSP